MTKTHASVLSEGVVECGWNQDTQKLLFLDYISTSLDKEALIKLQSFLCETADDELLNEPELKNDLEDQVAEILDGIKTGVGKYTSPEEIVDTIGDVTDWNESTKFQLVCRFLDECYSDKIELFETVIQQIIADETSIESDI